MRKKIVHVASPVLSSFLLQSIVNLVWNVDCQRDEVANGRWRQTASSC